MATRLAAAVVLVSLTALVIASIVGVSTGRRLGQDISDARLGTLDANGATNVAGRLRSIAGITTVLAASPATIDTLLAADPVADDPAGSGTGIVLPGFVEAAKRFDLDDITLVRADQSLVVYSAAGDQSVGVSLNDDALSGSILALTVNDVIADPSRPSITSDLAFDSPTSNTPVGVVASPVFDGDELIGVVASSYDGRGFTDLLLGDRMTGVTAGVESGDSSRCRQQRPARRRRRLPGGPRRHHPQ